MDYILKDTPQTMYMNKKIYMCVIFLVIAGGVNYLSMSILGKDFVRSLLGKRKTAILYLVIGLCALLLCFRRDVYLPFLGQAFIPSGALQPKTPTGATDSVKIRVTPGAKVIYWASEPDPLADTANPPSWEVAYGDYDNSGIVIADDKGEAVLPIRGPPQPYKVPMKGRIESHVHFRVEEMRGLFGPVKTKYTKSGRVEAFSNMI
jgi:uncharacterized membrane protein YuzA (DUF378 family)